ncbi:hypothetical protein AKO1_008872 [Acrasis kona]|uniref:Chitinase domain-containing protein 1 n=1 Tax=Acrasis kona TaxID=1008807 RepID=A0AAW2ZFQ3_9EUKA
MITGQHDIDSTWVSIVQKQGASVLPRLQFDWSHWTQQDFNVFFGGGFSDKIHQPLIDSIIKLVQERSFDGLVIEWGFLDTENILPVMKPMLTALFQELRLNTKSRQLFLVIPPFRGDPNQQSFTSQHYSQLLDVVDRFCVMTYDASGGRPSPNAPLKDFVIPTIDYFTKGTDQDLKASKLLLGLNFYGYKYSLSSQPNMDVVLGHDYKSIMSKHSPQLHWDENSAENFFDYTNEEGVQARVFYPSVRSIMARTKVATDRNLAGVMIWEVGQGLTEFVDLL